MENKLPKRKDNRLKGYDYSRTGAYFLTICTQHRKNILSEIVGEGFPLPELTPIGIIAEQWIKRLPEKYPQATVDCYVIMPNHIHLLLSVYNEGGRGNPSPTAEEMMGWLKYRMTKEINMKYGTAGRRIFQRSFFDHVVRCPEEYREIYRYICENPTRWKFDKLFHEE